MLKLFTPDDLILFYYKETTPEQTLMIKNALVEDKELKEDYLELRKVLGFLNKETVMEPSDTSVQIVLDHSRKIRLN